MAQRCFSLVLWMATLACACLPARAQELPYKDAREILMQAENTAAELENLLNAISNANSGPAEIQLFIEGSYTPGPNQIFYNKDVVVEDNIDPTHTSATGAQDKAVATYLTDFDIGYEKSPDATVKLDNRKMGPIRRTDMLFVNVLCEGKLAGKPKGSTATYVPIQQVLTMRAERINNRWRTFIAAIRFARPADSATAPPADVVVIQKTAEQQAKAGAGNASEDAFAKVMQEEARREYAESRRDRERAYTDAMTRGEKALADERYDEAIDAYNQAIAINSYDYRARARVQEVERARERRRLLEQKQTQELEALLAEAIRVQDYAVGKSSAERLLRRNPGDAALQDHLRTQELRLTELEQQRAAARKLDLEAAIKFWGKELDKAKSAGEPPARQADLLVARGLAYNAKNDFKRALADINKALEANAVHRPALLARAQTHLKMSEPYKALNDYTLLITNSRFSPIFYKERAQIKSLLRDTAGAIADYDQAIGLDAGRPDLYHGRGLLLAGKRSHKAAVADFTKALELEPDAARHYFRRGQVHLATGQVAEAGTDFAQAREKNPSPDERAAMASAAWASYEQGRVLMQMGKFAPALDKCLEGLTLNPELVEAALEAAQAQRRMQALPEAEKTLTQTLAARKNYVPLLVARAHIRLDQGLPDGALQDAMAAQQLEPHNYDVAVCLGDVYMAQDRAADALAQYKRAYAMNDELPKAWLHQGCAYTRAGQTDKAEDCLEKALKYTPDPKAQAEPLTALATNALRALDYDAAAKYADKSLKTGNPTPQAYLAKGRALMGNGEAQQGLIEIMRVADRDPDQFFPEARIYAAKAYLRLGQPPKARQELDRLQPARRQALGAAYWLALADCRLAQDSLEAARQLYRQVLQHPALGPQARYGLACCAAKARDLDQAFTYLQESLKARPYSKDEVQDDPMLKNLAADRRFKAIVKEAY